MMGLLKSRLTGLLLCSLALSAQATNKSSVINKTDQNIAVVWTALGCLHTEFNHEDVCGGRILAPGHSQRYQFNWGDLNDHIRIGGYFNKTNAYLVSGAIADFNPMIPSLTQTIGGNCQLPSPDDKVVVVSSITIDEDKWTVDCEYQIHDMNDDDLLYGNDEKLEDALFWNPSQKAFLMEEREQDADWCEAIDEMDDRLSHKTERP